MAEIQEIRSEESWVDVKEGAAYLGVSEGHLRKMILRGLVPAKPIGLGKKRYWRMKISEIRREMEKTA
jgi:hypothetical protein